MLHRLAHFTAASVRVHATALVLGALGCQVAFLRTDVTRSKRQLVSILRRRFPALSQRMFGTAAPEADADRVLTQLGRGDIGQRRAPRRLETGCSFFVARLFAGSYMVGRPDDSRGALACERRSVQDSHRLQEDRVSPKFSAHFVR